MAGSTRVAAIAAALLAAVLLGSSPAVADTPATPTATPTPTSSATAPAPDPAVQALATRIVELQHIADRTGEAAQKADERAHDSRAAADTAKARLAAATTAAEDARARALESRAQASAFAAQLARTDMGTLPLDLLLNGRSAQGVLGGLSTTGRLTVQGRQLLDRANADRLEAERLQAVAASRADEAAAAARAAETAYTTAVRAAAAAKKDVQAALDEQRALLTGDRADDGALCTAVGTAPVASCLPDDTAAPAGASVGAQVVRFALRQIGKPYVFAAAGPDSYDCSGLTLAAYASAGVSIGIHSATAQYDRAADQGDLVPLADAEPGDLLFYTDGGGDMYHVTIAAGEGRMIEAPYPGASVREVPIRTGDLVPRAAHLG